MKQKATFEKDKLVLEQSLESMRQKNEMEMAQLREKRDAEIAYEVKKLELEASRNEEQLRMMREMKALGVDLTQVLVSQQEQPSSVIKFASDDGAKKSAAQAGGKGILGALQLNLS